MQTDTHMQLPMVTCLQKGRPSFTILAKRQDHYNELHGNVGQLIVLYNKLNIKYDTNLSENDVIANLKLAITKNKTVKRIAESLNIEYRAQIALAKEEAGGLKAAVFLRNMNTI